MGCHGSNASKNRRNHSSRRRLWRESQMPYNDGRVFNCQRERHRLPEERLLGRRATTAAPCPEVERTEVRYVNAVQVHATWRHGVTPCCRGTLVGMIRRFLLLAAVVGPAVMTLWSFALWHQHRIEKQFAGTWRLDGPPHIRSSVMVEVSSEGEVRSWITGQPPPETAPPRLIGVFAEMS